MSASARQRDANRRNAGRSTGPRTSAGKARAAGNSLKHGLAVPFTQTPGAEARIEEMARAIAGEQADPRRLELARRVAEAQLDLVRIRDTRRRLLDDPRARMKTLSASQLERGVSSLMRQGDRRAAKAKTEAGYEAAIEQAFGKIEHLIAEGLRAGDPPSLVEGLEVLAPRLLRLERYERRATSRRKIATRAYDAYCRSCGTVEDGQGAL